MVDVGSDDAPMLMLVIDYDDDLEGVGQKCVG